MCYFFFSFPFFFLYLTPIPISLSTNTIIICTVCKKGKDRRWKKTKTVDFCWQHSIVFHRHFYHIETRTTNKRIAFFLLKKIFFLSRVRVCVCVCVFFCVCALHLTSNKFCKSLITTGRKLKVLSPKSFAVNFSCVFPCFA